MAEAQQTVEVSAQPAPAPSSMRAKVGERVHMNGNLYSIASGVFTWRAVSPSYHFVDMLTPDKAGASFQADEAGTYHVYLDTDTGVVDITVNVS